MIDGRAWIGRAAVKRKTGLSVSRQKNLYGARAENGHPPGRRVGRTTYFEEGAVLAFYRDHLDRKRAHLTRPVHGGDPDELLGITAAAALLGYRSASTIRGYLARGEPFPAADEVEPLPGGGQVRQWRRRTLHAFAADRTGPGPGRAVPTPPPPSVGPPATRGPTTGTESSTAPARASRLDPTEPLNSDDQGSDQHEHALR